MAFGEPVPGLEKWHNRADFTWNRGEPMKHIIWLVLLLASASFISAQQVDQDREHTMWIASVMDSIHTVKPGMTRQDLLKVFNTEGGLSSRIHRIYVFKGCRYIKVTVEFQPVEHQNDSQSQKEMPTDRIVAISMPFLQYRVLD